MSGARLAGMCGRFTQERPASELAEIFGAEPLVDDPGGRYNVAPTDEAIGRRPARGPSRHHGLPLGPHPALGDRGEGRLADVQRPGRDADHQPGLPGCVPAASLPRAGRLLLRVEARGHGPPAVPRDPRATGARWRSPGLWAGWRDPATETVRRTFTIVTTTPNDGAARPPRPDAGRRPRGRLGPLARAGTGGPRRAARAARPRTSEVDLDDLPGGPRRQRRPARRPRAHRAAAVPAGEPCAGLFDVGPRPWTSRRRRSIVVLNAVAASTPRSSAAA